MILISLTLMIAALACLQPAAVADDHAVEALPTFVKVEEESAGEVYEIPRMTDTRESESCAVVIADVALHLRSDASADAMVLDWLKRGEVVRVIDQSRSDWWLIERDQVVGYARSMYLEERTC